MKEIFPISHGTTAHMHAVRNVRHTKLHLHCSIDAQHELGIGSGGIPAVALLNGLWKMPPAYRGHEAVLLMKQNVSTTTYQCSELDMFTEATHMHAGVTSKPTKEMHAMH